MTVDELVARLDSYFRVADVRGDDWSPGFDACYPMPYWREYAEPEYENRWNGLMVRGERPRWSALPRASSRSMRSSASLSRERSCSPSIHSISPKSEASTRW